MKTTFPFDNSFAQLGSGFFSHQMPEPSPTPELIAYNDSLSTELGIGAGDDRAAIFGSALIPDGAEPLAQLYAGHQFGNYNPQLGDGRAVLLGEVVDIKGNRRDIQLKGSGRTPYSRGGDGKAWLGPVLREYAVSEAMHALGIPTTRALAAVSTGEEIYREAMLPGAIVTRVARPTSGSARFRSSPRASKSMSCKSCAITHSRVIIRMRMALKACCKRRWTRRPN